ncbi:SERINE/THREONINE-PROTEIN KINASE [Salix koriyanagi]|uniref:SERINE/THREONINE-PROTEIN KINASE n=1 Tax=Salix koriyanagi TaxID=2511006 RepID=A0A9Q0ZGN4_9ROSI|nr:SERINE/THREONINE-PROTEIN KINASE [Salix koriyanagi]
MGSCVSTPAKLVHIISKRSFHDARKPLPSPDQNDSVVQTPRALQIASVIKDPTGQNIHEKYTFGKELGRGEFGITYRCFDIKTGQRFREIVGSPYYMAPEILRRNYGPEVDVWSTGVILYILLCGVPPFWAETEEGIAQAIVRGEIDFTRDPWPKVSEEGKDLVKKMLDQNPYNRLTVEEVLENPWIQNASDVPNISLGENVVADILPDDQVDKIKQMFHMMDTDQNGDLSFQELKDGLNKFGHYVPDPDVKLLMDAADADGNGSLSCEEFVAVSVHLKRIGSDKHLTQAFRFFDKDQNGFIEFEELREAMSNDDLGPNNEQVIRDIIFDVDLDKDGRISYNEFKAMMKSGLDWKMGSRQYSRAMMKALSINLLKNESRQLK